LKHASEIKILLHLPPITLILILVNVKTLIILMLFLEHATTGHLGKVPDFSSSTFFNGWEVRG